MLLNNIPLTGSAGSSDANHVEHLVKKGLEIRSLHNCFIDCKENHMASVEYIFGSTRDIANLLAVR